MRIFLLAIKSFKEGKRKFKKKSFNMEFSKENMEGKRNSTNIEVLVFGILQYI